MKNIYVPHVNLVHVCSSFATASRGISNGKFCLKKTLPCKAARRTILRPPRQRKQRLTRWRREAVTERYLLQPLPLLCVRGCRRGESPDRTMACCRALSLQLLPASAHSRARINFHRRIRCCAAAGDQAEAPQDAVLKAISREEPSFLFFF